jgi:hypothetical protein
MSGTRARILQAAASRTAGSVSRGDELLPPELRRSVVDENVDTAIDRDLEWRRELDRPSNRRTAGTPKEHSLTGLHGSSVAHRRVSENDAEYPTPRRH